MSPASSFSQAALRGSVSDNGVVVVKMGVVVVPRLIVVVVGPTLVVAVELVEDEDEDEDEDGLVDVVVPQPLATIALRFSFRSCSSNWSEAWNIFTAFSQSPI